MNAVWSSSVHDNIHPVSAGTIGDVIRTIHADEVFTSGQSYLAERPALQVKLDKIEIILFSI